MKRKRHSERDIRVFKFFAEKEAREYLEKEGFLGFSDELDLISGYSKQILEEKYGVIEEE